MAYIPTLVFGVLFSVLVYYYKSQDGTPTASVVTLVSPEYDYVVVGGGSAGCVLAARLSEDEDVTVLLLEAGGEETNNPLMDTPMTAFDLFVTPATSREYTTPQKNACLGLQGDQCYLPRGRGLGGGSSHNCMHYVRGNRGDYDRWAAQGCDGWSYKDVLPYFIKSENNQIPELKDSPYHGTDGPLYVDKGGQTVVAQAMVDGAKEIGYKENDHNGEAQEGFSLEQFTQKKGERWSTAKGFLRPAMGRKNLHVATHAFATKVIFEKKRAVGVEFVRNDFKQVVKSRKEVLLSAGAIATPKLLMLSGVGPKDHLKQFNISVIADLPVGDNHQDHIMTDALTGTMDDGTAITAESPFTYSQQINYNLFGRGLWATGCGTDGVGFVKVPSQPKDDDRPYIEFIPLLLFFGTNPADKPDIMRKFNYKEQVYDALFGGEEFAGRHGYEILSMINRPFSRGTVRLASADPFVQAAIDVNYFADQRDVDAMVDGIRIGQKFLRSKAFVEQTGSKLSTRHHPGCKQHKFDTDDYWGCYVRHNSLTVYHSAGTCKMGPANDPTAVVDPQLRVRGLEGLRVVDTSIMPDVPTGNTNAPVIMVAEKAADMIRGKKTVKPANI